ncbi:MAG TPA: GIY-YIG nuclease family protein [Thermoanaerobaculia bacterium]
MDCYVYIVSNNAHTLYTGMTDNLPRRVYQHKTKTFQNAFTARYTLDRLVYFETLRSERDAAKRERQIKSWTRAKRVALIQSQNPSWVDLSKSWTEALMLH